MEALHLVHFQFYGGKWWQVVHIYDQDYLVEEPLLSLALSPCVDLHTVVSLWVHRPRTYACGPALCVAGRFRERDAQYLGVCGRIAVATRVLRADGTFPKASSERCGVGRKLPT